MNVMDAAIAKLENVKHILAATQGCVIGFSGGVDSSLLLVVAREVLGNRCLGVIAATAAYPREELEAARAWAREANLPVAILETDALSEAAFRENPPERCYYCKRHLFERIQQLARETGLPVVAEGSNADDGMVYRPGRRALAELGVISPLEQAGLTKAEIRWLAAEVYRLPMAEKPSAPCLATRFQYGTAITQERLRQVAGLESWMKAAGFRELRARYHGEVVRLELGPSEREALELDPELARQLVAVAKQHGFRYVAVDLEGLRSGSGDESLGSGTAAQDDGQGEDPVLRCRN